MMREQIGFCAVCGETFDAPHECVVVRLPSAAHRLEGVAIRRRAERIADALTSGENLTIDEDALRQALADRGWVIMVRPALPKKTRR